MRISRILAATLACASLTGAGSDARAALVAYDGFDGSTGGPLLGQGGGLGFSPAWAPGGFNASIFTNYTVGAGSLSFGQLATSGGSVSTTSTPAIAGLTRMLAATLGTPGSTAYVSVLLRPDGPTSGGTFGNFFGLYLNSSLGRDVFFGKPGTAGDYVVEDRGGTRRYDSGVAAITGQSVLLVLRADFAAGVDRFTLHVNPTPGGLEPVAGTVKQDTDIGTVSGLTIYSTGAFSLDEIRVGTTFADVVPSAVPEPSSLALASLGLVGAAIGLATRRKRSS